MQTSRSFIFASIFICILCWFSLIGCGGKATITSANASVPVGQPAPPSPPNPSPTPSPTPAPSPTPSPSPNVPSNAVVVSKIEGMPEWQWCTAQTADHRVCAAGLGNATSSKIDNQSTPSRDGSSSKFDIGGPKGYSNALWWKTLNANSSFTHFNYDVWFYIDNPNVSQALEFDVNQTINGTRYTWGSECNFKDTRKWDVWDPKAGKWVPSQVDCPVFSAATWHHLLWQLERMNGQVHYISLTVDGQVFPVDIFKNAQTNWAGNEIDVAFQMDGDVKQTPYNVWLNQVTLTQW